MASIDAALDRLYQLPPAEFTAARNALAKEAGPRAQDIRALPKPTLAVWAVNQVHWRHPEVYRTLVESAENLRATHKAVLAGRKADLRAASRTHEEAVDAALKAALALASDGGTPPSDAVRQAIGTTLRLLPGADPPGRLRQVLTPGGFDALAGLPAGGRVVAVPAPSAKKQPAEARGRQGAATKTKVDKAALARAQKAAANTARALAAAEQEARREEFEAARTARDAEKAERRIARAQEALAAAQGELEEAQDEAAAAIKKRDAARARAATADEKLDTAREKNDAAQRELRLAGQAAS